mmetsp:Transcript_6142/g.16003  ORF Transcript_6142/g.16003 Transcript_6142/m.16003 type:complete len:187 (-) Transcript_6142:264-824(-)
MGWAHARLSRPLRGRPQRPRLGAQSPPHLGLARASDVPYRLCSFRVSLAQAHRPKERKHDGLNAMLNATAIQAAVDYLSCEATGESKCHTGGLEWVGKSAACFGTVELLAGLAPFADMLRTRFGYDIRQQRDCATCRKYYEAKCACYCPVELVVAYDRPYSGVIDSNGDVVMSMQDLVELHPIIPS